MVDSKELAVFQTYADLHPIIIGIGVPSNNPVGLPYISLFVFRAKQKPMVYSKPMLHEDEWPYFSAGESQLLIPIQEHKIALGICYESLQEKHLQACHDLGTTVYIASVSQSTKRNRKSL